MLREHKEGLAAEEDLQAITKRLEKAENERHQQRLKEIMQSAAQAQLIHTCLNDPDAGEAGIIARTYCKVWAATYGVDLEAVRERKQLPERLQEAAATT